jgi:hypothetical protein
MRKQHTAASATGPMFFNFKWRMMNCTTSTKHNANRSAAKPFCAVNAALKQATFLPITPGGGPGQAHLKRHPCC